MIFRRSTGELLFIGRARRVSRSEALALLRRIAGTAGGVEVLRAAFAGVLPLSAVASLDDAEVLERAATCCARGELALVPLRPLDVPASAVPERAAEAAPPHSEAPVQAPPRRITDLRWSAPRIRIGSDVEAIFRYEGFEPGQQAVVTVREHDADGTRTDVDQVTTHVEADGGEHRVRWRREPGAAEGDLRDDQREGDPLPLEYHFTVEAEGASCDGSSGPLWLTNAIVVHVLAPDGERPARDGIEVVLRAADGAEMRARTSQGEARFEDVVIGPLRFEVKARVRRRAAA